MTAGPQAVGATPEERLALARLLARPRNFARKVLGADPSDKQDEILDALESHRRVVVPACHSSGKTFIAAAAVHWFLNRYPDAIVITTAPTDTQVKRLLWGDVHKLEAQSGLQYAKSNETELVVTVGNYAVGFSTNEGVRFQGFHSLHILLILDEAPGIRPDIYEAIEGIRAGGHVVTLMLGNPVIASGTFYENCQPDSGWKVIQIGAFDTPNLKVHRDDLPHLPGAVEGESLTIQQLQALPEHRLQSDVRPYLTSRAWVLERFRKWGPEDARYQSRVLGKFPEDPADSLIGRVWLLEARDRGLDPFETAPLPFTREGRPLFGLDVAAGGDAETALALRRQLRLEHVWAWQKADPREDLLEVLDRYKDEILANARYGALRVDTIGPGYYLARWLEDVGFRGYVVDVNVALAADAFIDPRQKKAALLARQQYHNLKARLYWELRESIRDGSLLLPGISDRAIDQLSGVRWKENVRTGRTEIESKEDMAKRGASSPDLAEAIMLCYANLRTAVVLGALGYGSVKMPMAGRGTQVRGRR